MSYTCTLLTIFITLSSIIKAQTAADSGGIKGLIIDLKTEQPIEFASIALVDKITGKPLKSSQSDSKGAFFIGNIPVGIYNLRISYVGYKPFIREAINITSMGQIVSLGAIKLVSSEAKVLQEVVVEGKKNTIQLGIDRKVFNVDQSLVSEAGSATDLLANIPSVSVDIDGAISLRGTGNVRILIDGKPSALAGSNMAQALQSIPASSIETIELVTNPSSKYDAEGQSGIINIVLKKNQKIGLNGSTSLSTGTYNNYSVNTNLNYRNNKWNFYTNYGFRMGNRVGGGFNNTNYLQGGIVNNDSENKRKDLSNTLKLGTDFSPNNKTTIGVSGNLSLRSNKRNEDLQYQYYNFPNENGSSSRISRQDEDDTGYDLSLDFIQKFTRKGEELTANISYGNSKEDGIQHLNQNFYTSSGILRDTLDQRINDTYEKGNNWNFQLDYTLPLNKKNKIEAGYRSSIRHNDESQLSELFNWESQAIEKDYSLTNDFSLDDIVHAAYFNYQNQLTKLFGFQAGFRVEQAYLNTDLNSFEAETLNPVTSKGRLNYFRVYPSIFLTQKLKGENQLQLSYSRRINRPRGRQVNPFRDISDPNNIRVGNPNLKPEDIHAFELSYMNYWKSVTFTSSIYFRQVNDVVQAVRLPLTDNNAATITQFFNLTKSKATGLELISRIELSKNINLTTNANIFYNTFSGNEQFNIEESDGYNWDANITSDIKLPKNISAQIRFDYTAPRTLPQGKSKEMYGMDAALRMDIFKNRKGSISLNVRNVLNSRSWGGTTQTNMFIQEFERQWQRRITSLTFSYRFGKQDFQKTRRNKEQQQNEPQEEMF